MVTKPIGKTILIVDDLHENVLFLTELLSKQGYETGFVRSGAEALASIKTNLPDLILLSTLLSDTNGFEVCISLKENSITSNIPVIFIRESNKIEDKINGFSAGGIDSISKPFIAEEILIRVKSVLENNLLRSQIALQAIELKKITEEPIKESEKINQNLFEKSEDAILILQNGKYSDGNQAAIKMLGVEKKEEFINKRPSELSPEKQTDGQLSFLKENEMIGIALKKGSHRFEWNHKKSNGVVFPVEVLLTLISNNENNQLLQVVWRDISVRNQMENALKESEEKLRAVFENSINLFYSHTPDHVLTYLSPQVKDILGYTPSEGLIKWTEFATDNPINKLGFKLTEKAIKSGQKQASFELELYKKTGEKIWVEVREAPVVKDGLTISIVGSLTDITQKKHKEQELIKSEARFAGLFNKLGDAVFVTGIDGANTGKIMEVNPAAVKQTGYSRKELLKMNIVHDLFISGSGNISTKDWNKKLRLGKTVSTTERKRRKDGSEYWTDVIVTPIEFKGELASLSINHDITSLKLTEDALKKSEEHFRAMFENTSIGFYRTTPAGKILFANPALVAMLGYKDFDELAQRNLAENSFDIEKSRTEILELINRPGHLKGYESIWKIKDNTTISIRENANAYYNQHGNVIYYEGTIEDISEEKKAERLLIESEEKYRTLIDNIQDGVFLIRDGKVKFVNEACAAIMGYTIDEVLGQDLEKFIAPESYEMVSSYYTKRMNGEYSPKEYELQLLQKDGITRIFANLTVERIQFENRYAALGTLKDISETKKIQELIVLREKYYRTLFDLSPSGIIVINPEGEILDINESFCKYNGYKPDELKACNVSVLTGEENSREIKKSIEKIMKGQTLVHEVINKGKDGSFRNIELHETQVTLPDGQPGILSIANDITERTRAEKIQSVIYKISYAVNLTENLDELIPIIRKELEMLIDTTNFFVASFDEETDTILLPFIADQMDTYTSFPAGKSLTAHIIKTKKPLLVTKKILEELESSGQVEPVGSDSEIWLGVPMFFKGKVTGAIVVQSYTNANAYDEKDLEMLEFVSHAISIAISRKKADQDLLRALLKANESDRLKSAFLANMSHEIRTPMNGILGFAELLKEPVLSGEEQQKYISIIEKSGIRMLNIINDLIDISKVESGQMDVYTTDTNINDQLEYLYTFFKPEVERKGMQLYFKNALQKSEAIFKTDREKIYAILTNLIKNAIKYSNKGAIEFGYDLVDINRNPYLQFYVKDSGIGIPKESQSAIFDRFIQANNALSSKYEGAGLGLAITKAYVEMLGGTIWMESLEENLSEGKAGGSTFFFTTPFITENKSESKNANASAEIIDENKLRKLKILVAEDDKTSELLLARSLKNISTQILYAQTGIETVDTCRNHPDLDLILMDIKMPEMDGYEATRQIRLFNKTIPIIAQSAFSLTGDKEKAMEAGCSDYISKPINRALLMESIHKLFIPNPENPA